jgi:hypothetical protein
MRITAMGVLVVIIVSMVILPACQAKKDGTVLASESFKKNHDYESLNLLVGRLRLGFARAEVERLLGPPDYSPIDGLYYYAAADRRTPEGTTIGLIVEYRRLNVRSGEEVVSGRLESFTLGPIAE